MSISKPLSKSFCAALCLGLSLCALAQTPAKALSAEIRRTTFGVPHIRAADERGLGYGIGYAYAQDNLCLLANEVITVNGQRSTYFGPEQMTLDERDNLSSDLFFTWLNTPQAVAAFWQAQTPEVRDLIEGYVAGYNRQLSERKGLPAQCDNPSVRPLTTADVVKLTRRLLVEGGVGQFAEALVAAAPPHASVQGVADARATEGRFAVAAERRQRFALDRGSNAVAIGAQHSRSGQSMLLANPHFPWLGGMRFYQMHLTIPDKLDVMGAALPGLPMINIGFNSHVAWTHTVDTSKHFTLYRLELDPMDPTRYLLDGQSRPLDRQTITVNVKQADGSLKAVSRTLYSSVFGPVVQWPGKLDWNDHVAFSLRDANLQNERVLQQWYAMNQARNLDALQASVNTIQGIAWVNTLAVDDQGQALYMNLSVVPYVDKAKLAACSDPRVGLEMIMLDGSRSACDWTVDRSAAQPGIFPADQMPQLRRNDYVQHSNDSAWMANPNAPLSGFSPLISQDGQPLGPRARFALQRLSQPGLVSLADLQGMVMDDRVYLAGQVMPDLLTVCETQKGPVCASLKAWDQQANLNSGMGLVHFQNIMAQLLEVPDVWRVPFNPADPQHTPRGLNLEQPAVVEAVQQALLASAAQAAQQGIKPGATWGDIQVVGADAQPIPIHGGPATLGVYNAMQSVPVAGGKREVVSGTSYLQTVTFGEHGPQAQGVLAFSISSDPASRHARDQTQAFSNKQWPWLPFTEAQIKADPQYELTTLKGSL
ncbi:acylase [Pseudomonas sp. 7P_10.2_Bac1]|uniref:bifunctional acylase PvdQ n=1 Tax=Pseudomonas sp. 7P_10.2_Bac1 TaxID=2971614 RepID=UPI0021C5BEC4|nr:acylase [Pseudomonas sp. 7P_10.2_Bac1]MCU1726754.1 acylase [Pseudomonas sp. 7P_10.2_Bac1]